MVMAEELDVYFYSILLYHLRRAQYAFKIRTDDLFNERPSSYRAIIFAVCLLFLFRKRRLCLLVCVYGWLLSRCLDSNCWLTPKTMPNILAVLLPVSSLLTRSLSPSYRSHSAPPGCANVPV